MDLCDLDIYEDLDEFTLKEEKQTKEYAELEKKYNAAIETIEALKNENKDLQKKVKIMQTNFQSLLDTAKTEIKRKDKIIQDLNKEKDDICFRRKRRKTDNNDEQRNLQQQHTISKDNSQNNCVKRIGTGSQEGKAHKPDKVKEKKNEEYRVHSNVPYTTAKKCHSSGNSSYHNNSARRYENESNYDKRNKSTTNHNRQEENRNSPRKTTHVSEYTFSEKDRQRDKSCRTRKEDSEFSHTEKEKNFYRDKHLPVVDDCPKKEIKNENRHLDTFTKNAVKSSDLQLDDEKGKTNANAYFNETLKVDTKRIVSVKDTTNSYSSEIRNNQNTNENDKIQNFENKVGCDDLNHHIDYITKQKILEGISKFTSELENSTNADQMLPKIATNYKDLSEKKAQQIVVENNTSSNKNFVAVNEKTANNKKIRQVEEDDIPLQNAMLNNKEFDTENNNLNLSTKFRSIRNQVKHAYESNNDTDETTDRYEHETAKPCNVKKNTKPNFSISNTEGEDLSVEATEIKAADEKIIAPNENIPNGGQNPFQAVATLIPSKTKIKDIDNLKLNSKVNNPTEHTLTINPKAIGQQKQVQNIVTFTESSSNKEFLNLNVEDGKNYEANTQASPKANESNVDINHVVENRDINHIIVGKKDNIITEISKRNVQFEKGKNEGIDLNESESNNREENSEINSNVQNRGQSPVPDNLTKDNLKLSSKNEKIGNNTNKFSKPIEKENKKSDESIQTNSSEKNDKRFDANDEHSKSHLKMEAIEKQIIAKNSMSCITDESESILLERSFSLEVKNFDNNLENENLNIIPKITIDANKSYKNVLDVNKESQHTQATILSVPLPNSSFETMPDTNNELSERTNVDTCSKQPPVVTSKESNVEQLAEVKADKLHKIKSFASSLYQKINCDNNNKALSEVKNLMRMQPSNKKITVNFNDDSEIGCNDQIHLAEDEIRNKMVHTSPKPTISTCKVLKTKRKNKQRRILDSSSEEEIETHTGNKKLKQMDSENVKMHMKRTGFDIFPSPMHPIFQSDDNFDHSSATIAVHANNSHDEIDKRLNTMFQSPTHSVNESFLNGSSISPINSCVNENMTIDETVADISTTQNISIGNNVENRESTIETSISKNDSKCVSLGSSDYRFEKISENAIKIFVTRKKHKKKKAGGNLLSIQ